MISTSEIRITVLVEESEIDKAVRAIHEKFEFLQNKICKAKGGRISVLYFVLKLT